MNIEITNINKETEFFDNVENLTIGETAVSFSVIIEKTVDGAFKTRKKLVSYIFVLSNVVKIKQTENV